jgi:myosin-5
LTDWSSFHVLQPQVEEEVSEEPLTFSIPKDEGQGVELDSVKLANEEEHDAVDDLIQLPHLHEASILHSLTQRFEMGSIYTFTANAILLAVNPFKSLPLYSRELLQQYYNAGYTVSQGIEVPPLPPHVFAIADSAYRDMMHGIQGSKGGSASSINQSILISGESGAGKTESTKFVMKYLTTVGNADGLVELEEGSVMDRVLQSNPILEAFGNAKTIRNDNSSRFGKFIELMFDKRGNLLGAGIETYLLETVRIPNQSPDERNFHIFYQMTKGASEAERERWALDSPDCYQFTNQGDCYDLSRMDDEEEFARTKRAMELMGFSTEAQTSILDLGAALLHLGQLEFEGEDHSSICMDNGGGEVFSHVLRLACLPEDGLKRALTEKTIEVGAGKEVHTLKLKDVQAYDARDALAKALYGNIFNYVVRTINVNINCSKKDVKASVGVLDIFGFECFQKNSFEQLCINYTNETLQQQFNEFVFKMEQKEYTKEGIEWSFVEFPDNQDCLDLIESRPNGLFAMLDDECRMGIRGSDANYASRLYKAHEGSGRFSATQNQKTNLQFSLRHYAGEVEYTVETFLDKNKVSNQHIDRCCRHDWSTISISHMLFPSRTNYPKKRMISLALVKASLSGISSLGAVAVTRSLAAPGLPAGAGASPLPRRPPLPQLEQTLKSPL